MLDIPELVNSLTANF